LAAGKFDRSASTRFWPFRPLAAAAAIPIILGLLIAAVVISDRLWKWPTPEREGLLLTGVLILSIVPVALAVLDLLIERGGAVEAVGIKLNFARVVSPPLATLTMPANLGGTPGQAIADSATSSILDTLRQARLNDIVVVDLGLGSEWWETRLLVLLAGAVRLRHPELVIFTATDRGVPHAFQGWARPDDLFALLLSSDQRYEASYWEALAAASQWSLDPPPSPMPAVSPIVFQGLAAARPWMRYRPGTQLRNELAPEQALQNSLGAIEISTPPAGITIDRLVSLFRPVLRTFSVDETEPGDTQLRAFLGNSDPYIALTRGREYQRIFSRAAGLTAVVRSMIEAQPASRLSSGQPSEA
jgi:hypothetical protein